jgi:uncharacterized protein (TIGR02996 family)
MDPFAAAVRDAPDDDLPRLIYADWLEERGDPRGAFIRAQVERARLPEGDPRIPQLDAVAAELLADHEDAWLGGLADELVRWWFHRGFLEVSLDVRRFVRGETPWLDGPTVAGVHLYGPRQMSAELLAELLTDPRCRSVRSLFLGFEYLRDEGAELIAGSERLPNLVALDLGTNGITDAGAVALARSERLGGLRHLILGNNLIGDAGAAALAGMALQTLDLTNNDVTAAGAEALAGAGGLAGVASLKLAGNRFDGRSRGARRLRRRFGDAVTWR